MIKKGCLLKSRASVARHVRMFLFPKQPKNAQAVIAKNVCAALQVNWSSFRQNTLEQARMQIEGFN